jgi:hypothetical protein
VKKTCCISVESPIVQKSDSTMLLTSPILLIHRVHTAFLYVPLSASPKGKDFFPARSSYTFRLSIGAKFRRQVKKNCSIVIFLMFLHFSFIWFCILKNVTEFPFSPIFIEKQTREQYPTRPVPPKKYYQKACEVLV